MLPTIMVLIQCCCVCYCSTAARIVIRGSAHEICWENTLAKILTLLVFLRWPISVWVSFKPVFLNLFVQHTPTALLDELMYTSIVPLSQIHGIV